MSRRNAGAAFLAAGLLGWAASVYAQSEMPARLLSMSETELERLIYAKAEEIRQGRTAPTPTRMQAPVVPRTPSAALRPTHPAQVRPDSRVAAVPETSLRIKVTQIADSLGIPVHLALGLVTVESNWNARAVSHKGAIGLAQVLPATARAMKFSCDLYDPECNLQAGFTYLRAMLDTFGDPRLALAGYNAGPGVFSKRYSEATRLGVETYVRDVITTSNQSLAQGRVDRN